MKLTVVFFVLLFLCQFGFGDCDGKLPEEEVTAMNYVLSGLGFGIAIDRDFCYRHKSPDRITINCTCSYKQKTHSSTTCHIEEITTDNINWKGGFIDKRISDLKFLKTLDLGGNQFFGSIPDTLGQLQNLETLDLSQNLLTGTIPPSLGKLKSLKSLDLSKNLLTGTIPPSLGKLKSLKIMDLEVNNLTGPIPPQLQHLGKLQILYLNENQLNGTLPPDLGSLKNLEAFDVSSNNLTGKLPDSYKKLVNLKAFWVVGNNLEGSIPNYVANWKMLMHLHLAGNEFTYLPPQIFKMEKLRYLIISDLSPGFSFPNSANLSSIITLVLRNCLINGSNLDYVGNWKSLKYLDLSFNNLDGMIPESLGNLTNLDELYLSGNNLNGMLPRWMSRKNFSKLELSYNNLTLPCSMNSDAPLAKNITPTWNDITDMKDKHRANHSKYDSVYINCGGPEVTDKSGIVYDADNSTSNYYKAPNGKWIYTCSSTTIGSTNYIQNMTCGAPPNATFREARLCPISLSYYAFGLLEGPYNVTLHFAETLFTKDEDYSSTKKRIFDIYIQDELKRKDFNIKKSAGGPNQEWHELLQTTVKKEDNSLHIRLQWAGKGSRVYYGGGPLLSAIAVCSSERKKKLTWAQIAGITVGSVLIPLLLLALAWKRGWLRNKELDEKIEVQDKQVTMRQIIGATNNFSWKTRISQESTNGRFGDVYKAELKDPPVTLAVKKISTQSIPKDKVQIQNVLLKLQYGIHQNLVQLLQWYPKKLPILVIYEYMEKGNLHHALFDGREILDWKTKLDICLGIANGLKYLHDGLKIVHGNVTDKNILLDQNNIPKLSEFGLATLFDDNPFSSKDKERRPYLLATLAPECSYDSPTTQADIYSFGHVMLEIVSGQASVNDKNDETRTLMEKAAIYEKEGNLIYLVDRESTKSDDDISQAVEVIKLAMKCLSNAPSSRPEISDIVQQLKLMCCGEKQSSPSTCSSQMVPPD